MDPIINLMKTMVLRKVWRFQFQKAENQVAASDVRPRNGLAQPLMVGDAGVR